MVIGSRIPLSHEPLRHACQVGHLVTGQPVGTGRLGQASEVTHPGGCVQRGDLGEGEALVGQMADLGQSLQVGPGVEGPAPLLGRGFQEAESLVVADGVHAQAADGGHPVDGQRVAVGECCCGGHPMIVRAITLSVHPLTVSTPIGLSGRSPA